MSIFFNQIRGSLKFADFFRMGTFIDSTHMKLYSPSKKSPPTAMHLVVSFKQLLEGPIDVNDLCHSLFHLLNSLITTASELRE